MNKICECDDDRLCEKCATVGAKVIQKILKLNQQQTRRSKMNQATLSSPKWVGQPAKPAISITLVQAVLLLLASAGKVFTVTYVKRTDGCNRVMNARLGVRKELKSSKRNYKPALNGLICVFDMQKKAYRSVDANTILSLNIDGKHYEVTK